MRLFLASIATALLALGSAPLASGQQRGGMNVPEHPARPVMMELFSSQGCGNCPAANANLAKLAERSDVIAVTYPVNIWDYLGWDDTFAKPEFTERQKKYNRALGYRGPYTPQVVYSGAVHGPGTSIAQIEERFAVRDVTPYPATITFEKDLVLVSGALPDKVEKGAIVVVQFHPGLSKVTPGGGPNKGKAMTYWNLVTKLDQVGEWKGGAQRFPVKCTEGCVVMVQRDAAEGKLLGVAQKR